MATTRRTQQERRDVTERALIASAAEVAVESGLRSVTLAEVGRRAGYSRGIVTHHFGSKQALVEALATASQTGFVAGLGTFEPGLPRLLALLDGYPRALTTTDTLARAFLVLWVESVTSPALAAVFGERDAAFRADVVADVEAGQRSGEVVADVDAAVVAAVVVAELRGLALQRLVTPEAVDVGAAADLLVAGWRARLAADRGSS